MAATNPLNAETCAVEHSMHIPTPDRQEDEKQPDVRGPPVPPDQEPDVVPVQEPPKPDGETAPMIAGDASTVG